MYLCSHLACYSGHAQATIALVKAGDISDLSAKDYDVSYVAGHCT